MKATAQQTCETCHHWDGKPPLTLCRKNPPTTQGWPKTCKADWCGAWVKRERPQPANERTPVSTRADSNMALVWNYAYVRDYPERATQWLTTVGADRASIPEPLLVLVDNPLGNPRTEPMPEIAEQGHAIDPIYFWAEQIPGFDNEEDDDAYVALLISDDDQEAVAASRQALDQMSVCHPWRELVQQAGR